MGTTNERKKVAIIGAGAAGLVATKCCLEEGLFPFCFESEAHIGGQWNVKNKRHILASTLTNVSKELSCFSDFLFPGEASNFLSPNFMMGYFSMYAEKFDLLKYVHVNHTVKKTEPIFTGEHELSGWSLDYTLPSGEIESDVPFDAVIVATGFCRCPYLTEELKQAVHGFTGEICHSSDYQGFDKYIGKTIVLCGFGNSGGDIGCELSYHARQVFLCTNTGSLVLKRYGRGGSIADVSHLNRITESLPFWMIKSLMTVFGERVIDHKSLGLQLSDDRFSVIINEEIVVRISTGTLRMKAGIKSCHGNTVILKNGETLENVDAMILCTGYKMEFPFLSEKLISLKENGRFLPLYRYIFPVSYAPSLSFVGMTGVLGSIFPVAEMQGRYIAAVLSGRTKLPESQRMEKDIKRRYKFVTNAYQNGKFMQVRFVRYMDELAEVIGVKPQIMKTLLTDFTLGLKLLTGPPVSAQYRLTGPHSWAGAREACLHVTDRVMQPLQGSRSRKDRSLYIFLIALIFFATISTFLLSFVFGL